MAEPENTGESRNPDGTFKKGVSGNPAGKPPGAFSITAMIRERLQEVPLGQVKTYGAQIVERMLEKAVVEGNDRMIAEIWHYMDGMPRQPMDLNMDRESLPMLTEYLRNLSKAPDIIPTDAKPAGSE